MASEWNEGMEAVQSVTMAIAIRSTLMVVVKSRNIMRSSIVTVILNAAETTGVRMEMTTDIQSVD